MINSYPDNVVSINDVLCFILEDSHVPSINRNMCNPGKPFIFSVSQNIIRPITVGYSEYQDVFKTRFH